MNEDLIESKRRTLWVNPSFQIKFILLTLGTTFLIVIFGFLSNWVFIWKFVEYGNAKSFLPGDEYFKFIYKQEATLNLIFLVSSSIIMIFSSVYALVMSNKIAGPIYRIRKELEKINSGEKVDEIQVREDDYFQDLVVSINQTLSKVRSSRKTE